MRLTPQPARHRITTMDRDTLQDITADVLEEFASDGDVLTVGAVSMRAVESVLESGKAAERWGANTTYRQSVTAPRRSYTAGLPAVRSTVTWCGSLKRIADITESRTAGTVTLHLEDSQ